MKLHPSTDRLRLRSQLEARRRQRILAWACVGFLALSAFGFQLVRQLDFDSRPPVSPRTYERSQAAAETRVRLARLDSTDLVALGEILIEFPLFKTWIEPQLLQAYRSTSDPQRREQVLRLLVQIQSARVLKLIQEQPPSARVPVWALEPYLGGPRDPVARGMLWSLADQADRPERGEAIRSLLRRRDHRLMTLLPELARDAEPSVRSAARHLQLRRLPASEIPAHSRPNPKLPNGLKEGPP